MSASRFLQGLLRKVVPAADTARSAERRAREVAALCQALLSQRGEVSGTALAREALNAYQEMPENAFKPFIDILAKEMSPDAAAIVRCARAYEVDPSAHNLIELQRAVEPPRQELFRRLNIAAGGTAVLVDLRRRLRSELKTNPHWLGTDADLEHLFASWFNRGFLRLERIDWQTPAIVLEKLIAYEAVHEITGWPDLQRRLAADRRCFAFFHPALPDEPLIFVEAALTGRISESVQPLLDPDAPPFDPSRADCAIFYSITNCQDGLRGISFGNLLIKQVVHELSLEFPRMKIFATLSPIPGFKSWLKQSAAQSRFDNAASLLEQIQDDDWYKKPGAEELRMPLLALCACYLTEISESGDPLDPVARFHLGNGARIEQINWLADTSREGMQRSAGMMVNYLYKLADVEANHEAFVIEHRIAASYTLKKLARDAGRPTQAAAGSGPIQ